MLQLFANGNQLDTAGVSFNLTLKNPLFMRTRLEGDYAYSVSLPVTDKNLSILNYPGRLERKLIDNNTFVIAIYIDGICIDESAKGFVTNVKSKITLSLAIGAGSFISIVKNMVLPDIDFGRLTFEGYSQYDDAMVYLNETVTKVYPERVFNLPMIIEDTDVYLPSGASGYYEKDTINFWNTDDQEFKFFVPGHGIIVPMLYLRYVLKTMFEFFGYHLSDNEFFDDDYSKLLVFNLFNINDGIPNGEDYPGYDSEIIDINYSNHIPEIKITDFITQIQNKFNVIFFFDKNKKQVTMKFAEDILLSADYIDITDKTVGYKEKSFNNYDGFSIECSREQNDALSEVIGADSDETFGIVDNYDELPSDPKRFLTYYVRSQKKFYYWSDFGSVWLEGINNFSMYKVFLPGNDQYNISTAINAISNLNFGLYPSRAGFSAHDWRKIGCSLLFYLGQGESPEFYPCSNNKINDKSLYLTSTSDVIKGLYDNHFKKWIEWMISRNFKAELEIKLTAPQIKEFDFSKKYRINGINYLIEEIKIPITERSIGISTMTCYKV